MPVELLLLLLAWAVTISLIVVLPWLIVRLAVGVLEADVSKPGADHEHARPRQPPDAPAATTLSSEPDDADELDGVAPPTATLDGDADSADR